MFCPLNKWPHFLRTAEIAKLGVLLPVAKRFKEESNPTLPIPKGPDAGQDLALVEGGTAQVLGRNASKMLWSREELKRHMLSPKGKNKKGSEPRTDF